MRRMTLEPCVSLAFDGQCEAAFKFYERCLGGKITFVLRWGDSALAEDVPVEWRSKLLHATLVVGNVTLQGTDSIPGSYDLPRGFVMTVDAEEIDAAQRLFAELAEGGRVRMPLEETFWARRYGQLTDRFGIPWAVNCHKSE